MTGLVGVEFIHSGRVDELDEARFAIGNLFDKLLFIDDDVRAGAKLPDGTLKNISEAKLLTGEHKFKAAFSFVNRAFPILLCNNLPSLADLSPGGSSTSIARLTPRARCRFRNFTTPIAWASDSGYSLAQIKSTVKKNLTHQGYAVKRHGPGQTIIGLKLLDPE